MKKKRRHRCTVPCDYEFKIVFHRVWSAEKYNKKDWMELQRMMNARGIKV